MFGIFIIAIAIPFFAVIIFLNIYTNNRIVRKAIKKIIIPDLQNAGLTFVSYKSLGLFGRGDFKDDGFAFKPTAQNGSQHSQFMWMFSILTI